MTTPDDKTLDMIVFNARQVAVAMSGEYAELAASADDYRTMADVITALRDTIASRERSLSVTEDTFEAVVAERDALRERIGMLEAYAPPVHIRGGPRDPVAMWFDRAKELEAERDALREWVKRHG